MNTTEIYKVAERHNGNVPLVNVLEFVARASIDAVEELTHAPSEKPDDGSSVLIQTHRGAFACGVYRNGDVVSDLTHAYEWGCVLRWVYLIEVFGEGGKV